MYGQMNEPPGARARVALTGLTVAEYFRDQEGQDVLLFIDNIFRLAKWWMTEDFIYRVTHLVGQNLPLTSKKKFRFGLVRPDQAKTELWF